MNSKMSLTSSHFHSEALYLLGSWDVRVIECPSHYPHILGPTHSHPKMT